MCSIEEIIKNTVDSTILALKENGILRLHMVTTYHKTENLLRNYNALSLSSDPAADKIIQKIESALSYIKSDSYYEIIPLYYIGCRSREELAEKYGTTVTTISRNKSRLIRQLQVMLFPDEYIKEIYNDQYQTSKRPE